MLLRGWIYVASVLLIGSGLIVFSAFGYHQVNDAWLTFAVLTILATIAQLVEADGTTHQSYYPHHVFFFAGAILLPFSLIVPLIAIPHIVEWLKKNLTDQKNLKNWYLQPFNIATFILATGTAHLFYNFLKSNELIFNSPVRVFCVFGIAAVYILINSVMIATALWLARGVSFTKSGIFSIESLMPEIILANLGYALAILWVLDGWLIIPVLSPILILHEALKIPQLKQEAQTDPKTNLLNSRYFERNFTHELERAKRFNRPLTLIMADLDLMRNINNSYGHLAGDAVLVEIANIIRSNLRPFDFAGRFGGEEFAIVLPEVRAAEAIIITERLRTIIAEHFFPIPNHEEPIHVTMSFGIATFPKHSTEKEELLHAADVAVYYAKACGRNRVVGYDQVPSAVKTEYSAQSKCKNLPDSPNLQGLETVDKTEEDIEQQLSQALVKGEFELFYQPQMLLEHHEFIKFEALIRWRHPKRGLIMPGEFIPIAEQNGFITVLDRWILEEACKQGYIWNNRQKDQPPFIIGVNFSALSFESSDLVEVVREVLHKTNLNPNFLEIEITETTLLNCDEVTLGLLNNLRNLGVRLAIDDFGTGYASFNYINSFPIDTLKIARSFVEGIDQNPRKKAVVQTLFNLGQLLNIAIVAEGVERVQELQELEKLGCHLAQGYFLAHPMPIAEVERLINTSKFIPANSSRIVSAVKLAPSL